MSIKRFGVVLVLIFVLALSLRVGLAASVQGLGSPPDAGAQPDQVDYELCAWNLASTGVYGLDEGEVSAFRPPGTSLTLLPIYLLFGRDWELGRLWFCLLSAATCVIAAVFARRAFGDAAGLFAGLWLALYPGHMYFGMHFLSEGPYCFWFSLACCLYLLGWRGQHAVVPLLAGLCLGMATLTRPQALLVVPPAWLLLLFVRGEYRRPAFHSLLLLTVGFAAVLGFWLVRNTASMGKATISTVGGCTFWGAHNEAVLNDPDRIGSWIEVTSLVDAEHPLEGDELEEDALCWSYGLDFVREHPSELPRLIGWKVVRLCAAFAYPDNPTVNWGFAVSWILTAPLALIGLLLAWRRSRLAAILLLLPLLATVGAAVVFYGNVRFRQSVAFMYVVPAALAVATAVEAWWGRRRLPR